MSAHYRLRDVATDAVLADRIRPAHTHWTRLRGLLGTRSLAPDEGLWLKPCRQVHMFGMRYAIDVVFLDASLEVVQVVAALRPGAISPKVPTATSVVELAAGAAARMGLTAGSCLALDRVVSTEPAGTRVQSGASGR